MRMGRRGLLAAAAGALVGCAPSVEPGLTPAPSTVTPPTPVPLPSQSATPIPSPAASPKPSVTVTSVPGRDEIVAAFSGRVPSQWGLEVDGVVLRTDSPSICLTFDACGGSDGSGFDEELIATLVDSATPATLFLNSRWIEANVQTVQDLVANPLFELANHGTRHVPLSVTGREAYGITGTASVEEVYDEVFENQMLMTSLLGTAPRFFRSGTAHFDEVAAEIVRALGLLPVNFDVNSDAGATFSASQVREATGAADQGSICIAHFNRPGKGTAPGIRDAILDLKGAGATFTTLGLALV